MPSRKKQKSTRQHRSTPLTRLLDNKVPSRPRIARNAFERALLKLPQDGLHDSFFPTDEELNTNFIALGARTDQLDEYRKQYHKRWDEMFEETGQTTIRSIGLKPQAGDVVHTVIIPASSYSIRLWDGGLEAQGQYCLDFIDTTTGQAKNIPRGWKLCSHYHTGAHHSELLISWETAWGLEQSQVPEGKERFSIIQGAWCALDRPNHEVFWFEVPQRRLPAEVAQTSLTVVPPQT